MAPARTLNVRDVSLAPVAPATVDPSALAASGSRIFAEATALLGGLRAQLSAMGEDLSELAALSHAGETVIEATRELARRAACAADAMRRAVEPGRAEAARAELGRARAYLHAIARASRTLAAVATLTRATAGSYGVVALSGYLEDLSTIARAIHENVQVVGAQLALVGAGRDAMAQSASVALGRLDGMQETIRRVEAQSGALLARETAAGAAIAADSAALSARGRAQIKAFVGMVQFADRLAQRLDHLGAILAHDDVHARRLAAAQIDSICAAIRETADGAAAADGEIGAIGRAGGELFLAGEIADAIREGVERRAEAADGVSKAMLSVKTAVAVTRDSVAAAGAATDEARRRFAALETCAKRIGAASINSALLAARAGPASALLTTLAAEVRIVATQCLAAVGGCEASMNALSAIGEKADSALLQDLDALAAALEAYRREIEAGAARLDALTTLCARAGTRMDEMRRDVEGLGAAASQVRDLADALAAVGLELGAADADGAAQGGTPDPAILTAIWDLYTMDDERAVHAELFAEFGATPAHAAASQDLDDILF